MRYEGCLPFTVEFNIHEFCSLFFILDLMTLLGKNHRNKLNHHDSCHNISERVKKLPCQRKQRYQVKENKDTMSKKNNILFQRQLIAKNICI